MTDDELLALATDRNSLESEAQSALWEELKRRNLNDPRQFPTQPDELSGTGENPAFNTPAKIAAAAMAIGWAAFGVSMIVAAAQSGNLTTFLLAFVLIAGSIFGGIAWATRRALRHRVR